MDRLAKAVARQNAAYTAMTEKSGEFEELIGSEDEDAAEKRTAAEEAFKAAEAEYDAATRDVEDLKHLEVQRARKPDDPVAVAKGAEKSEPAYHPGQRGVSFFKDLIDAKGGEQRAYERLERNNREWAAQQRAGMNQSATTGGEFVPPLWLNERFAELLRAGRAFVNAVGTSPHPPNTNSINLPKITTGATVAVQADAGSVSNTDQVTTSVTAQTQTIAGRTVASYQIVDMGVPDMDRVFFEDLVADYAEQLDAACLNGSVTNAKGVLGVSGINAITYTDATPTSAEYWAPIFQAKSSIEKNAFVGVDFAVTHPSVWNYILAGLDSSNRPLALATNMAKFNAVGEYTFATDGYAGNLAGIPLVVDANMPSTLGAGTNESRIVLMNRRGLDIWETTPSFKVADQTSIATLQYQFVLYGYYAIMSRQAKMISAISGTGLVVQSGY